MFNLGKLSVEVPVGCDQVFAYALNGSFFEGYPVARDRLPLRLANALGRYTKPPSIFCFFFGTWPVTFDQELLLGDVPC